MIGDQRCHVLFVDEDPLALLAPGAAVRRVMSPSLTLQHVCGLSAGVAYGRREQYDAVLLQPAGGALAPLSAAVALLHRAAAAPIFLVVQNAADTAQRAAAFDARVAGVVARDDLSLSMLHHLARLGVDARAFSTTPPHPANSNVAQHILHPPPQPIAAPRPQRRGPSAAPLDRRRGGGSAATPSVAWVATLPGLPAPAYRDWTAFARDLALAPESGGRPANDRALRSER